MEEGTKIKCKILSLIATERTMITWSEQENSARHVFLIIGDEILPLGQEKKYFSFRKCGWRKKYLPGRPPFFLMNLIEFFK